MRCQACSSAGQFLAHMTVKFQKRIQRFGRGTKNMNLQQSPYWWLVKVTLMVVFVFLPQNLGGGGHLWMVLLWMLVQWWGYHEVVMTLKPYHIQKNLFQHSICTHGQLGCKNFGHEHLWPGMNTHAISCAWATWWNFYYFWLVGDL